MNKHWYKTKRATTVVKNGDWLACYYHDTPVVQWRQDKSQIVLNSGGYLTKTTKTRMNEVASNYALPFRVYQEKGEWYVTLGSGSYPIQTLDFSDGMVIKLTPAVWGMVLLAGL